MGRTGRGTTQIDAKASSFLPDNGGSREINQRSGMIWCRLCCRFSAPPALCKRLRAPVPIIAQNIITKTKALEKT